MAPALSEKEIVIILKRGVIKVFRCLGKKRDTCRLYHNKDIVVSSVPVIIDNRIIKFDKLIKRVNDFPDRFYSFKTDSAEAFFVPDKRVRVKIDYTLSPEIRNLILMDQYGGRDEDNYSLEMGAAYEFMHDFYFLEGDNKDNSIDSRNFGPLPDHFIHGKVIFHF